MLAPQDLESGDRFVTSPLSGDTYRLPQGKPADLAARVGLWLDGVRQWCPETRDPLIDAFDYVPPSANLPAVAAIHLERLDRLWSEVSINSDRRQLRWLANRIASTGEQTKDVSPADALHLAHALRVKTLTNCLPHSFWQAGLLIYFGVPVTIHVGVWLPTDVAHAWVMSPASEDQRHLCVIGDTMDRVMHYAPTLTIEYRGGSSKLMRGQNHRKT